MRVIFLLLTLDLLGVSGLMMSNKLKKKIEGSWKTIYLASSTVGKISEGSPLRTYFRRIKCGKKCEEIHLYFYIKKGPKCQPFEVIGKKNKELYQANYEGETTFMVSTVNERILLFNYFNKDRRRTVTRVAGVLGKTKRLNKAEMREYMDFLRTIGIEDENIQRVLDTDTCPSKFRTG